MSDEARQPEPAATPSPAATPPDGRTPDAAAPDAAAELPKFGRLLGLDHGKVRVGVAVSDTGQEYAAAVETYVRTDPGADAAFFKTLKREYDPVAVVDWTCRCTSAGKKAAAVPGRGRSGNGSPGC